MRAAGMSQFGLAKPAFTGRHRRSSSCSLSPISCRRPIAHSRICSSRSATNSSPPSSRKALSRRSRTISRSMSRRDANGEMTGFLVQDERDQGSRSPSSPSAALSSKPTADRVSSRQWQPPADGPRHRQAIGPDIREIHARPLRRQRPQCAREPQQSVISASCSFPGTRPDRIRSGAALHGRGSSAPSRAADGALAFAVTPLVTLLDGEFNRRGQTPHPARCRAGAAVRDVDLGCAEPRGARLSPSS